MYSSELLFASSVEEIEHAAAVWSFEYLGSSVAFYQMLSLRVGISTHTFLVGMSEKLGSEEHQ